MQGDAGVRDLLSPAPLMGPARVLGIINPSLQHLPAYCAWIFTMGINNPATIVSIKMAKSFFMVLKFHTNFLAGLSKKFDAVGDFQLYFGCSGNPGFHRYRH